MLTSTGNSQKNFLINRAAVEGKSMLATGESTLQSLVDAAARAAALPTFSCELEPLIRRICCLMESLSADELGLKLPDSRQMPFGPGALPFAS